MMSDKRSKFSSPFDEMLQRNWQQFEKLYDVGPRTTRPEPRPARPEPPARAPDDTDTIRFLNDRFGDRWRYEINDRRREGDEVIVLCKLILEDQGVAKTQFGRARIGSRDASAITGSADGISFAIGPGGGKTGADTEEAAHERAVDRALAKCAEML